MGKISQQADLKFRKGFFRVTPRLLNSTVRCGNEAREIREIEDKARFGSCTRAPMLQCGPGAVRELLQRQRSCRACTAKGWPSSPQGGGFGGSRVTWMVGAGEVSGVEQTVDPMGCTLCPW